MTPRSFAARAFGALSLTAALFVAGCHPAGEAASPGSPHRHASLDLRRLPVTPPLLAMAPSAASSDVAASPFLTAPVEANPIRAWTDWQGDDSLPGKMRSEGAVRARLPVVKEMFAKAGVAFPPAELGFVAFKAEKELEVWAAEKVGGPAKKIATYAICAASGDVGPKRYEGDYQVPEGYYVISYGWAESAFHLEMKVSYPNMVDRVLGPKTRPLGGEIMIHGSCGSIGCLAMSDERVEELWTMAKSLPGTDGALRAPQGAQIKVHLYPSRDMDALLRDASRARHHAFWQNLKEGKDRFDRERRFFPVTADWRGAYLFGE